MNAITPKDLFAAAVLHAELVARGGIGDDYLRPLDSEQLARRAWDVAEAMQAERREVTK
ncbi:MAG: hypothetical protein ACOY3P_24535 [Planctomycetota bacterium]